jgi:hypothetical protein
MVAYGTQLGLARQAATPAAGFPLQNGSPFILTWTAPNDGQLHRATVFASLAVGVAETGGQLNIEMNTPGGFVQLLLLAGTNGPGAYVVTSPDVIVGPGQQVTVAQVTPLTAGAAIVYAEIWGS